LKASQVKLVSIEEEWSYLEIWINKVLYRMMDYDNESKEVRLRVITESIEAIGTPNDIRERLHNLVCQKMGL
jgi:hypothetical protein